MALLDGWLEVARGRVGPETIDYNGHIVVFAPTVTSVFPIPTGHIG
jgi:hypothetical protein